MWGMNFSGKSLLKFSSYAPVLARRLQVSLIFWKIVADSGVIFYDALEQWIMQHRISSFLLRNFFFLLSCRGLSSAIITWCISSYEFIAQKKLKVSVRIMSAFFFLFSKQVWQLPLPEFLIDTLPRTHTHPLFFSVIFIKFQWHIIMKAFILNVNKNFTYI